MSQSRFVDAPLPPPPPVPAHVDVEGLPGPPPINSHLTKHAPEPDMPPMPPSDDMDMEMEMVRIHSPGLTCMYTYSTSLRTAQDSKLVQISEEGIRKGHKSLGQADG